MFVFPVQVSSPSSLLLRLSSQAEGQAWWRSQRNEREGGKAHSDLWYEFSSTSPVETSTTAFVVNPFFFWLFFFCQRRTWTAKLRMRSRWWRWWDFLLLTPLRLEHNDLIVFLLPQGGMVSSEQCGYFIVPSNWRWACIFLQHEPCATVYWVKQDDCLTYDCTYNCYPLLVCSELPFLRWITGFAFLGM